MSSYSPARALIYTRPCVIHPCNAMMLCNTVQCTAPSNAMECNRYCALVVAHGICRHLYTLHIVLQNTPIFCTQCETRHLCCLAFSPSAHWLKCFQPPCSIENRHCIALPYIIALDNNIQCNLLISNGDSPCGVRHRAPCNAKKQSRNAE